MYIESVPNRSSPPAVLLRESWREDGKVRKRTLANLSCLSSEVLEGLKVLLRGGVVVPGMNKANVSFVAVDVNDATNRGVVFDKGPGVEENFLQEMSLAGIASTSD
jgi:hypothetical protein